MTVNVSGVNDDPVITSSAIVGVPENVLSVSVVTLTDVDGGTPVYSISGGIDASRFVVDPNSGEVRFASAPNYEVPSDANADNTYEVDVTVSDGLGGSATQTILVSVHDANDIPQGVDDTFNCESDSNLVGVVAGGYR